VIAHSRIARPRRSAGESVYSDAECPAFRGFRDVGIVGSLECHVRADANECSHFGHKNVALPRIAKPSDQREI